MALNDLFAGVTSRGKIAFTAGLGALLLLPEAANSYWISIFTLIFWFAYVGQAWNVMMGFAGQLSLGHALYVGLGGYGAAALYLHLGLGPWIGMLVTVPICAIVGMIIGWLGFRFGVRGVHFALLTIACAEFTRVAFDHITSVGGSGGLFLPVVSGGNNLWALRGAPELYYYTMLVLALGALALCRIVTRTRLGYFWLALRENPDAAAALGIPLLRVKLLAVGLSAGMTAIGGVFYAFYYNNLFPDQIFSMGRSIEILLGPIIGGIGTVFGPILGAMLLTPIGEATNLLLEALGIALPGTKQVIYGLALVLIILLRPAGIWPWLAVKAGLVVPPGDEEAPQ
ncbi:branched-chain amino acid ABC transporter permease [Elstera cyanobacteriorum]|uniref:branched-chain amino acid ABC transporter permease n=1 Tax=Elstera cyanobacteriorum TaxID=2022747 RepID=UPI002354F7D8|nr:branched-chain amino acid ABC transporter permease [Elstera cyanobacteriorum]MCK6442947.1 branched-chain amino acid ABC transporter permease [Elstera cyanobacteriorum]